MFVDLAGAHIGTFKRMNPNYEMPIIKPEVPAVQRTTVRGGCVVPAQPPTISTSKKSQ